MFEKPAADCDILWINVETLALDFVYLYFLKIYIFLKYVFTSIAKTISAGFPYASETGLS